MEWCSGQRQTAMTAHLSSKQLLLFASALQRWNDAVDNPANTEHLSTTGLLSGQRRRPALVKCLSRVCWEGVLAVKGVYDGRRDEKTNPDSRVIYLETARAILPVSSTTLASFIECKAYRISRLLHKADRQQLFTFQVNGYFCLLCKGEEQRPLTCRVSRYCLSSPCNRRVPACCFLLIIYGLEWSYCQGVFLLLDIDIAAYSTVIAGDPDLFSPTDLSLNFV